MASDEELNIDKHKTENKLEQRSVVELTENNFQSYIGLYIF